MEIIKALLRNILILAAVIFVLYLIMPDFMNLYLEMYGPIAPGLALLLLLALTLPKGKGKS